MRRWFPKIVAVLALLPLQARAIELRLGPDGDVPLWLTAGPFEQPLTGFGVPGFAELFDEANIQPAERDSLASTWVLGGRVAWRPSAPAVGGFVDLNAAFADVRPGAGPEKIWWAKAGFAFVTLVSPGVQDVVLHTGSTSRMRVRLNGQIVHTVDRDRNVRRDEDSFTVRLREGENHLLVYVGQSHQNAAIQFFDPLEWGWGFHLRVTTFEGQPAALTVRAALNDDPLDITAESTPFFRRGATGLEQRFDVSVTQRQTGDRGGVVQLNYGGRTIELEADLVPLGVSRWGIWGQPVDVARSGSIEIALAGGRALSRPIELRVQPRLEMHLLLMTHTDVGYTHPQPTVSERLALTLDDVIRRAEAEPDFAWTIETGWQLEQFVTHRSSEEVARLVALIRSGRISVPVGYANPFTGWLSEEELIESFRRSMAMAQRHGYQSTTAISNDVPGLSWIMPAAFTAAGARMLVVGINEVYGDYAYQRALPKAFRWVGADGSAIPTFLSEAYNEGQSVGLVKGVEATAALLRERLDRQEANGDNLTVQALTTTLSDNGPIPDAELAGARAWNEKYAYPRIVISTLDRFSDAFLASTAADDLPIIRGDWTSDWDVLSQGELARTIRQREVQHGLPAAQAIATAASLDDGHGSMRGDVAKAYGSLLQFSAHGSGLEYGYGSPQANRLTQDYRESYVENARLQASAILQRATQRLATPLESFDGQGVLVFNATGSGRDAPVEVHFPAESPQRYRVLDSETGAEIPSHQDETTLRFVARGLPGVGYDAPRLEPRQAESDVLETDLSVGEATIENAYFAVRADPRTGALTSIRAKRTDAELVRQSATLPFGGPVFAEFGDPTGFHPIQGTFHLSVVDELPARVRLVVERPGAVISRVAYSLWENLERVDVEATVDLEALGPVERTVEYGLAFPFAIDEPSIRVGLLGGFVDPLVDRLPGARTDAFSVRQSVALSGDQRTVSWAASDSRVVKLAENGASTDLVAVLANHFPPDWNRHEENRGSWTLRFAFTAQPGPFDPAFTDAFGRSLAQETIAVSTWLRSGVTRKEILTLTGDPARLSAFEQDGADVIVRLQNPSGSAPATVRVALPGRDVVSAEGASLLTTSPNPAVLDGSGARIVIGPNELTTLRLRLRDAPRHE